jgi:hypothetical protein
LALTMLPITIDANTPRSSMPVEIRKALLRSRIVISRFDTSSVLCRKVGATVLTG